MTAERMSPDLARERLVYALVLLFPVAGVSVRSWFSGIFTVLVLLALWDLFRGRSGAPLHREEKVWLWLCAGFFVSFVVSSLANGWGYTQTRHLEVDVRYLLVVPLYLMLRRHPLAWRYLLAGAMLAAPLLAVQAYCDVQIANLSRAQGVYSPNLLGPVAVLVALWLLSSWHLWGRVRWLLPFLAVAALGAVALSGSRGAYIGLAGLLLIWAGLFPRGRWWRSAALIAVLTLPFAVYHAVPSVAERVDDAMSEVDIYFEHIAEGERYGGGTAVRFEMWRVGWMVFKDAPLLGIGRGNYLDAVGKYIDAGVVHSDVGDHGHAHNAYVEVLMSRGLSGFIIFIGMLFYPLVYLARTFRESPHSALLGILHITGFALFSLTDASPFIKGNFVAIFLLCLSVFLSWHVARVKGPRGSSAAALSG